MIEFEPKWEDARRLLLFLPPVERFLLLRLLDFIAGDMAARGGSFGGKTYYLVAAADFLGIKFCAVFVMF